VPSSFGKSTKATTPFPPVVVQPRQSRYARSLCQKSDTNAPCSRSRRRRRRCRSPGDSA
jgi:hypothetical protein